MRIVVSILLFLCCGSALPVWAEPGEIGEKGCKECHRFSSDEKKFYKGPDLFFAGNKFYKNWLTKFLQTPVVIREVNVFSGSNLLREESKAIDRHVALKEDESEKVANYLMTLRLPNLELGKVNEEPLSKSERARAKVLFERTFGCISCHRALNLVGKVRGGVSGPSLINSGERLKPDWVFHWLKRPEQFMHEGRMPVYDLNEETAVLITKYILSIRKNP
jgi:mono/diheme cytochrome c family protein